MRNFLAGLLLMAAPALGADLDPFFKTYICNAAETRCVAVNASNEMNVSAAQGTAAILSGAWPVKVTDGTNTMPTMDVVGRAGFQKITDGTNVMAVKAASTAAQASDPSAVVAMSPNSPLPAGSNTIGKVDQGVQGLNTSPWYVNLRNAAGTEIGTTTNPINNNPKYGTGEPTLNRTDVSLSAQSASSSSSALTSDGFGMIAHTINVTAISGTSAALQVDLEYSDDGTNWRGAHGSRRMTATGSLSQIGSRIGTHYYRYSWTITGTTPSITFNIVTTLKSGSTPVYRTMVRYAGISGTTLGNVSASFSGAGCSRVTVQNVRGADGGNNGKLRLDGSENDIDWNEISADMAFNPSTTAYLSNIVDVWNFYRLRVTAATNAGTRVGDLFWSCVGG